MNQKQQQQNTRRKTQQNQMRECATIMAGGFNTAFSVANQLDIEKPSEKWRISNNTIPSWTQMTGHDIKQNNFSSFPEPSPE